tara:strand:- start:676 stop:1386 length:711 start_codon:yes stop_codon:yes gene_type:complete
LDSNYTNRILVGLILIIIVFFSFYFHFELYLISILIPLISYDFYNSKFFNPLYIILLTFLPFASHFFLTNQLKDLISILICLIVIITILSNRYKKEFFLISVYIFCILLFNIASIDRNIFYIIIFISFFNDTTAYIFGKTIGGPLIIPKISPKKTWSGTSISFVLSTLLLYFLNFNLFFSALISIFLFLGDIFFSYIKRILNLEDFSLILKSHGGILDRLDSMFFVTIIFQIYLIL